MFEAKKHCYLNLVLEQLGDKLESMSLIDLLTNLGHRSIFLLFSGVGTDEYKVNNKYYANFSSKRVINLPNDHYWHIQD